MTIFYSFVLSSFGRSASSSRVRAGAFFVLAISSRVNDVVMGVLLRVDKLLFLFMGRARGVFRLPGKNFMK